MNCILKHYYQLSRNSSKLNSTTNVTLAITKTRHFYLNFRLGIDADLSPVFTLADTCLQHAKEISSKCSISNQCKSPPPIPPKPSRLSVLRPPPPLPIRPLERAVYSTEMKRATSKPEFVKRTNVNNQQIYSYSDDDTYTDDDDYEDSDDDEEESTKIEVGK